MSIDNKGRCYCRPEFRGIPLLKKTSGRCECGFKVRGVNHISGPHHLGLSAVTK